MQVYQNHLLAGAWVLVSGLQSHLAASTNPATEKAPHLRERDDKGRSPSKSREPSAARSGLSKFQQSFGVLSVALANRALALLTELFEDLHLEMCGVGGGIAQVCVFLFYLFECTVVQVYTQLENRRVKVNKCLQKNQIIQK